MDVSGQLKAFLDHLGYRWMPHRPHKDMFKKIGVVISTAAGGGTKPTNQTMKRWLEYMGVNKVFSFGANVAAMNWNDINDVKKVKIINNIASMARKINKSIDRKSRNPRLFTRVFFKMMIKTRKSEEVNDINKIDHKHWEENGWLNGINPWN